MGMGGKGPEHPVGRTWELEVEAASAPQNKHKAEPKVDCEFRLLLAEQCP